MTSKMKNKRENTSALSISEPLGVKLDDAIGNHITYKVNSFLVFQNNDCGPNQKKQLFSIFETRYLSSNRAFSEAKLHW